MRLGCSLGTGQLVLVGQGFEHGPRLGRQLAASETQSVYSAAKKTISPQLGGSPSLQLSARPIHWRAEAEFSIRLSIWLALSIPSDGANFSWCSHLACVHPVARTCWPNALWQ